MACEQAHICLTELWRQLNSPAQQQQQGAGSNHWLFWQQMSSAAQTMMPHVYIGPKSRTERSKTTKIGTEVAHVTRDSDATFKIKRSKVNLQGAGEYCTMYMHGCRWCDMRVSFSFSCNCLRHGGYVLTGVCLSVGGITRKAVIKLYDIYCRAVVIMWSREAGGGGSPDVARLEQTPYPFRIQLIWRYFGIK